MQTVITAITCLMLRWNNMQFWQLLIIAASMAIEQNSFKLLAPLKKYLTKQIFISILPGSQYFDFKVIFLIQ
jgi:hypothetical protein